MILLATGVVVIAVVLVLNLLLTFGLVAKLRELQLHGGIPARDPDLPQPGMVVGPFSIVDTEGATICSDDLGGAVRVGFFAVGCGPCTALSDGIVANPPAARFISIVDGDPETEATKRMVAKLAPLGRVAIIDVADPVLAAFGVNSFPTLLHLHSGVVTASGSRLHHFTDVPAIAA